MPRRQLKRFLNPETIRQIDPSLLGEFLAPYRAYFSTHDVDVEHPDHGSLIRLLIDPGTDVPGVLVDALYLIHECSAEEVADDLLRDLDGIVDVGPHITAVELALRGWLAAPEVLRRRHAEAFARRQKSYRHFAGASADGRGRKIAVDVELLRALEANLDGQFETHHRGRGCHVEPFIVAEKPLLVVRHGKRKVRQPSVSDEGVATVEFYRPQVYDVIVYDPSDDTIAVHAATKWEVDLYLEAIGRVLFDDPAYFTADDIFTLSPLIDDGAASMNCSDVPGMESIRFVEFQRIWGGAQHEKETRQADDIFAAFAARGGDLRGGTLTYAVVKYRVTGSDRERSAKIRPRATTFDRDADSELLGLWMQKRGFIRKRPDEAARRVLAVA